MERTFEDLYTELQKETGDDSTAKLVEFKRWINRALTIFQARLRIRFTEQIRLSDTVANQAQYQRPEDASEILDISFDDGSQTLPLKEIVDNSKWQLMNATAITGVPTHYHKVSEDLYELYPVPSAVYNDGIVLNCRIKQKPLSAANYTTGTVSIALDGSVVTGVGTTFTAAMVGRRFRFADGAGNGVWYRIAGFTDTTHISLENAYSDDAVSAKAFIIAEIPELPNELHDSLYDYAYWRWLLGKREMAAAREYKAIWESALADFQPENDLSDGQVYGPEREPAIDDNVMQSYERAY